MSAAGRKIGSEMSVREEVKDPIFGRDPRPILKQKGMTSLFNIENISSIMRNEYVIHELCRESRNQELPAARNA